MAFRKVGILRKYGDALLKLVWGAYLALTSLYCLLAFLPYTYYALIKEPAYAWMPWFVRHFTLFFWIASLAAAFAFRPRGRRRGAYFAVLGLLVCVGALVSWRPILNEIQSNATAYWASVLPLWLVLVVAAACGLPFPAPKGAGEATAVEPQFTSRHIRYATGSFLAVTIAFANVAGAFVKTYSESHTWQWHIGDSYTAFWSVISHVVVALIVISILNAVYLAAAKTKQPQLTQWFLTAVIVFALLRMLFLGFLESALSFGGWRAQLYATSLAMSLTLLSFSMVRSVIGSREIATAPISSRHKVALLIGSVALLIAAVFVPALLGGGDWNGFYQGSFTLVLWVSLAACALRLWPRQATYSLKMILAVLLLSVASYKALEFTQLFWAKPLGATEDEIQRGIEGYAARDVSFHLTYRLLGNGHTDACGDLCRILREYTEVRDARAKTDLNLVTDLTPTTGERPNIFIFVIDSMRPDYLGAYNGKATFTPNLDTFAKGSVVFRNVFTPYAGTSLSEPAIWAGALLLHAHFLQPFERVNSLEKLAKTDGYQMAVSYDEILKHILAPSDSLLKLDTDKKLWSQIEACSTVQQAERAFDQQKADAVRPIFFYMQPKNVHQFARNNLPQAKDSHWPVEPGFNYRISFELHQVDECLGGFFAWMKARGLYDNSLIVVTSDHGDATGEFGRNSHSLVIYPEIMRVPLMIHLPRTMQKEFVHDDNAFASLTDIAPSLYYLLGHRPILRNSLFGRPLFARTEEELHGYPRNDLLLASDVHAAYGIVADNGRYLYATYDSPAHSYLFDLAQDPNGEHDVLTPSLKKQYDQRIIEYLHEIGDFYGYKPGVGSLLSTEERQYHE